MTKVVQLKLASIKYSGDAIGDDIRIEIECMDHFLGINKKIRRGSTAELYADIGKFLADQPNLDLQMKIRIIERDLIFNDVGNIQGLFTINVTNNALQEAVFMVEITEARNYQTRKKAIFTIVIQAQVSELIAYVGYREEGWIQGIRLDTKKRVDLVSHLKVFLEKSDAARQYFEIREGVLQGIKASIKKKTSGGGSYFEAENPHTGPVHLVYSLSDKTLRFDDTIYATRDYQEDRLKKGIYDIEIPDYAHAGGEYYLQWAKLAKVWFHIGHDSREERYIHLGTFSRGCVTLTERDRWDALCNVLMRARKEDGRSTGVLEVVD